MSIASMDGNKDVSVKCHFFDSILSDQPRALFLFLCTDILCCQVQKN